MRKLNRILAGLILVGGVSSSRAEEWPQWRGPQGDGISRETGLLTEWPAGGPKKLWTMKVGSGHASPIAVDGKLYVFTYDAAKREESLKALDAATGKTIWSQTYPGGYKTSGDLDWNGTRATPTVVGDKIYTYGGGGDLVARTIADGKEVWHINVLTETKGKLLTWGQASTPLVADGVVYVQGGKGAGAAVLLAVNANDGKTVWQSAAKAEEGEAHEPVAGGYAYPLLITVGGVKQLIVFGGALLYGMNPADGATIWSQKWLTQYDVNASTPVYREPNLFVTSGYNHGCMMLELSAGGAKKLWENKEVQSKFNADVLDRGFLYAMTSERGNLKCLSWPDGKVKWEDKAKANAIGAGGSFVRFGDYLILLSERGTLSLARANPDGFKPISQVPGLFEGKNNWATPLIYHGKLYVKGQEDLVCFDISAGK